MLTTLYTKLLVIQSQAGAGTEPGCTGRGHFPAGTGVPGGSQSPSCWRGRALASVRRSNGPGLPSLSPRMGWAVSSLTVAGGA